ncbi:MAG TPA: heme ABC exporter ATP-binding protein CcmA [Gemmatimonadales bacterium]|nr:heme ABC exporter ATP-binding protein CcmA [Gemmatimonadales bacterium]
MLSGENLQHAFGPVRALDGISFALTAGQTLALFGPNGAGKTTLLKVLAGLIEPQGGTAQVEGGRAAVGWIGHQSHLYGYLTVRENLLFWARLYHVPQPQAMRRADELLARLDMTERGDVQVRVLSRGMMQRATIARALIHDPKVLLLDEPFTGLDLAAAAEFRELLAEFAGTGRIIVLATHNVDEGVELATDIAFQSRGRFVHFAPRGNRSAPEIAEQYRRMVGIDGGRGKREGERVERG